MNPIAIVLIVIALIGIGVLVSIRVRNALEWQSSNRIASGWSCSSAGCSCVVASA